MLKCELCGYEHTNSEVCRVCKQDQLQGEALGYCTLLGRYVGTGDCRSCTVLCMGIKKAPPGAADFSASPSFLCKNLPLT